MAALLARWSTVAALVAGGASAQAADPQIAVFSDSPDPVPAGGNVTYSARIDNSAVDAATAVRVAVPVPSGTTFVSATAPCVLVGSSVECNLGTVGANSSDIRNLAFVFRALGPGTTTVTANATLTSSNDTNAGNNVQAQTTTVTQGGDLSLIQTDSPDPVVGGANLTYTLTASNAGPNASGAIVLTDNLPPSVTFVSWTGSGWNCAHASGVVTCTRPGPHAAGATIPAVTIVAKVNAVGGTVTNSATIAPAVGGTADPNTDNNTATLNTTVLPGADVNIAQKTVTSATPATAGSAVTFQIQPRNAGPAAAANAVVTDTLPSVPAGSTGWSVVSANGPNWSCSISGTTVACTRTSLPVGATDNITVVATAPPGTTVGATGTSYTNTASISSATGDPAPGNNSGSVGISVLPDGADLRVSKTKAPSPVAQGSNLTSTLRITNGGPRVATGPLRVIDQLAAGETYVSSSGSGWSCTASGGTVVCNHSNASGLAVGANSGTLSIVTQAVAAGSLVNTACTGNSVPAGAAGATASPPAEGDPNPTNDCASASATSTVVQPDLGIVKTTTTPSGGDKIVSASESSVTYTLAVTNATASPRTDAATGVRITDTVPGFISGRTSIATPVVATASAGSTATFSCAVSSATVTCNQSGGALAPGETVRVPITVNRPLTAGTFTNTAAVANTVEGDPNSANNSASDTVTVEPIADIEVTGKTVTPAAARAGETATYVVSFRNNGPSPAASVALADAFTFPAGDSGLTVLSIALSKSGSTCTIAAGAQLTPASPGYGCTIGTMANGETQTVTLVVRPNFQPGNGARSFTNTAGITTATPESPSGGDNGNNSRSASLTVNPALVDLLPNKVDFEDPVPFAGNAFLNYRVTVTNNGGPSYATGVRINEVMAPPAGKRVRFVCDTTGQSSATCNSPSLCSATDITSSAGAPLSFNCTLPAGTAATGTAQGDLAATQSKSVFLRFEALDQPPASGDTYNNVATVVANEPDSFISNDSSDEQTTVRQRIDLAVAKSASAASVALRQPFTWTVAVTNNGPGNSVQTDVTDTLPAGVVVTGPITFTKTLPAGSGTCGASGSTVSCALGALNAAGVATISIPARIDAYPTGGTVVNTASVDTDMTKIGGVDPVTANNSASHTVAVTRSSIAGTVFQDRDRTGANAGTPQAAAAEPRIANVSIRLTGTDAYGNAVDLGTTTDTSGNYGFMNLSPSSAAGYTLTQTQPAGYTNSPAAPPASGATAPSDGGTYAAGGSGNSTYTGVVIGAATVAANYNFPELRQASLSGFVYIDQNLSGARDAGDTAVPGAMVRLLDAASGVLVATATTDGNGAYVFSGIDSALAYTLEQPLPATPAGLRNGPVTPGQVNGAACAAGCTAQADTPAAGTDRIAAINLTTGDGTGFNFGERQLASVAGLVYVDADRDNALGASDTARLAGVTVRLVQGGDCASGTTLQTTATAPDGTWRFDNVLAYQNYLACQTQPAGYGTGNAKGVAGSNVIAIAGLAAAGSAGNDFGETLASLSGAVYQDSGAGTPANADNGARDAGELGIAGVPVTLSGRDVNGVAVNAGAVTDASGNWRIDGLLQSDAAGYTVVEGAIPASSGAFNDGKDTAGSAGGSAAANDRLAGIVLGAGAQASGYLFGELAIAPISGTVYLDRNRSGALDALPVDGRIGGVTISLRAGLTCAGATVATTVTDAGGAYSFSGVSTGLPYTVCETQPIGYADGPVNAGASAASGAPNSITIAALPAAGSGGNHFGELAGSLAGAVYVDHSATTSTNNNGARDPGEAGVAGVTVTLSGRDVAGAAVNATATTDTQGTFRFDDLLQSDAAGYTVVEGAIPASAGALLDGKDTAGSAGGSVAVNDRVSGINLAAGATATGYAFGELPSASIEGGVYLDRNRNGAFDGAPTDAGLAGVTLRLVQGASCAAGIVLQTVATAADGGYVFNGIAAGQNYLVCETQPAGYADGTVTPGAGGSSAAANAIAVSNLPAAGSSGNRFGERAGSLSGYVFLDANHDGARAGDAALAGVAVTLSGTDATGAPVSRTVTSDASGAWRFDDLLAAGPGGYVVTEQAAQPAANGAPTLNGRTSAGPVGGTTTAVTVVPSAVSGIALAAGADATDYNFGEILPSTLSGAVFVDLNNNGVRDAPGEAGLANVALVVTGSDDAGAVSRSVSTAADGSYAVTSLRPGTYTVTEPTQPANTSNGLTVAGSAGGTPTTPGTAPSAISGIAIALPGTIAAGYNFAELAASGSMSGRVWLDVDNDGVVGGSEVGIAGVTVELTGTDLAGNAVSRSTVTDAQGNYGFANLLPGSYAVREPTQPPNTLDGRTSPGSSGGTATAPGSAPSAVSAILLAAGQSRDGVNFGELPAASLSGRVWADNDNDGRIGTGESGLPGVTLRLTGTDDLGAAVSAAATTDASGAYAFSGLRPGIYTLTEPAQPPGTVNGITKAGSAGGTATPPATTPSAVSAITLAPGTRGTGYDFGEVGSSPDLVVAKTSVEARFTVNNVGNYSIRVRNAGSTSTAALYTVTDRLPVGLALDAAPTGAGWTCTGSAGAQAFACTSAEALAPAAANPNAIAVKVRVAASALANSPVHNAVLVEGGGEIDARAPTAAERDAFNGSPAALPICDAAVLHNACRAATPVQAAASVSGTAWADTGSARGVLDAADRRLKGWTVEVVDAGGSTVARAITADDGAYRVPDLLPGVPLAIRFRDPQANIVWGYPVNGEAGTGSSGASCNQATALAAGTASSCPAGGANPALAVVLAPGQNLPQQSLPVDPSGVVYDSGTRQPVAGAVVTLAPIGACAGWNPSTGLVAQTLGGYAVDGAAVSMTVGGDGYYQFLLSPAAPANCTFGLTMTPPPGWRMPSALIPPAAGPLIPPGAAGSTYAVQPQATAPIGPVGPATLYYLTFTSGSAQPGIVHNHLPLDADAPGGLALRKTGDKAAAEVGDSVRYTVTVQQTAGSAPLQTTIVDRLPAGFTFIPGTAQVGGKAVTDPAGGPGPRLTFELGAMSASGQLVLQYRARIGVGAQQGEGVNRARGYACNVPTTCVAADGATPLPVAVATNEGQHRVRVGGGVFTTDACVLGKIYVDCNGNHVQDAEELGIPGVRLLFSDGTFLVSDSEGKYSFCGLTPRSHVLKVDGATLPRGSRLTTTSNRNLGDANSLWLDLKNGELHRADFAEGSCSNTVLDQVKARRAQGEVRTVELERRGPALRFDSKAHGRDALTSPQQGTDSANQQVPKARAVAPSQGGSDAAR